MPRLSGSWFIAALGFIVLGFSRGINSSFGVFYVALLNTFGWSRGATAGVFSANLIVDAIMSPVVGHLLDRYGPKRVVGAGCLFLVSGLWLSSQVTSLWQFYLFFGLVCALGFSFMGMVPHVVLISEWFSSNRASALGLVFAGTGVGLLVLAPLIEWLISNWGWERALQSLAVMVAVMLAPLVLGFYRRGPYQGKPSKENGRQGENQWTTRLALRSLQFWLLFFARVVAAGGTTVIITHQVAHVVDIGYSRLYAATVFGLMGVTSTFGRVIFGAIADLVSKRAAYTLNVVTTLVGVAALMIARDTTQPWLLYLYLLFFGIGFGSRAVIFSALTADIFSGKRFGAILGFSVISVGAGGALGSWLGGFLYDVTGSYLISFGLSTVGLILSDLCVWLGTFGWVVAYDARLWPAGRTRQR
ncbi:MAG: MFS transporter [Deltaproteobacteria bacterium]|nr:MFS transporter [Deltaproteobacteria bacterium]